MKIDGKAIADALLTELSKEVTLLKQKSITPTLAVIQVGDDPGSTAYINQKRKAAQSIGAIVHHEKLPADTAYQHVNTLIRTYNADPTTNGLIVQQPLPGTLSDAGAALLSIAQKKDIDGFLPNSPYPVPVAAAVTTILKEVYSSSVVENSASRLVPRSGTRSKNNSFLVWLMRQSIVVIGRGETAGKPIAEHLTKIGCTPVVVHSQTANPDAVIRSADVVISCVGKPNVVRRDNLKPRAMLIGVGLWRDREGKLHGDYEEEEIADVAAAFTPTPGGVGPVNVACLMQNLVLAAQKSS